MRKTIAVVLVLILIICIPLVAIVFNLSLFVFNPDHLSTFLIKNLPDPVQMLQNGMTYSLEQMIQNEENVLDESGTDAISGQFVELLADISEDEWEYIMEELEFEQLSSDWIRGITSDVFKWLEGSRIKPDISLSVEDFKDTMLSKHGENVLIFFYDKLPVCNEDFSELYLSTEEEIFEYLASNLCRTENPDLQEYFLTYFNQQIEEMDDELDLTIIKDENIDPAQIQQLKLTYRIVKWLFLLSILIPFILSGLIILLCVRNRKQMAFWIGVPWILGGLILFSIAYIVPEILFVVISNQLTMFEIPFLNTAILDLAAAGVKRVFQPLIWQSIGILIIDLILIAVGLFIKTKPKSLEANEQ